MSQSRVCKRQKKTASLSSSWNKFLIRPKWMAMSKQRIDVFLPFQDHKISVQSSSQRGSSQGKLLFIHCLGWMAQFRYSLVVRKRTWKKEITRAFVGSWVFSKNYTHRYPSSAGGTNFVYTFFFLFVPWQAQIQHSLCRPLNPEGKASRISCTCSDLRFHPAFVTGRVLQVFLQARLYLNNKQKTRFMG